MHTPLERMYSYAIDIYGEDKVFIRRVNTQNGAGYLIVHFPEVTITNTEDRSHLIRDLYIRLKFKIDGVPEGRIYGARATLTTFEKHNHYYHSHLPSAIGLGGWEEFCLGGGSEIATAVANIAWNAKGTHEKRHFEYFLHYLRFFAAWESIEGNPYISISDLTAPGSTARESHYAPKAFIERCIENLSAFSELKVRYSNTYPYVVPIYNKDFERYMAMFTTQKENFSRGQYIGLATINTLDYLKDDNAGTLSLGRGNDKVICKVINDGEETTNEDKISQRVPKFYRELFETVLKERLSAWAARTYPDATRTAQRESNPVNLGETIFENIVPVSAIH